MSSASPKSHSPESLSLPRSASTDAVDRYRNQLTQIDQQLDSLARKDTIYGRVRVGLALTAIALWLAGADGVTGASWLGTLAFALFFVAATLNEPIRDSLETLRRNRAVIERLVARLRRDWDHLATKRLTDMLAQVRMVDHRRETAGDLDLLSRASLFHLVSMAATMPGVRTLCDWLSGPAIAEAAKPRFQAASVLAPLREERIRFYTLARQIGESTGNPDRFVQWATGERWLEKRTWLVFWMRASMVLSLICIAGLVASVLGLSTLTLTRVAGIGLVAIILINAAITTLVLGPAHEIFSIAMSNRQAVANYIELFSAAKLLPQADREAGSNGELLQQLRQSLCDGDDCGVNGMKSLARVATAGSLRQSAGTFLVYLPLQAFLLWDVRVLARLEDWQVQYCGAVENWFDSLGSLEALMSLAALHDDYPQWNEPIWVPSDQAAAVTSIKLGHPLLADDVRVTNDVSIGPTGTILLVTGSNMSGKSTMLRSVGLNVALAGAGAPVCAQTFSLPSIELATSIRVSDDLSQGVSFYMAELNRLKSVVDHARQMSRVSDRICLFLLDEILQGTNSRERQIAVVQVLEHLVSSGAIGAITTHDLELADEEELMSISTTVHFRETIEPDADGNEKMTFDYQMHAGISPTTNALRLLEMVGLGGKTGKD